MMNPLVLIDLSALVFGYVLGSLPFAVWVSRACGVDILKTGSGNPGMTNVWRTLGWKPALPVALLDAAKGFAAAALGAYMTHSPLWALLTGIAAVLGHSFSFWVGFKGGKSVLTGFGVFLYLSPVASLTALALWGLALAIGRFVSLASILAALTLPVFIFMEERWRMDDGTSPVFWAALPVCLFVIVRHRANILRLLKGTEPRFGGREP